MPNSATFHCAHSTYSDSPDVLWDLHSLSTYSCQLQHASLFGEIYYLIVSLGLGKWRIIILQAIMKLFPLVGASRFQEEQLFLVGFQWHSNLSQRLASCLCGYRSDLESEGGTQDGCSTVALRSTPLYCIWFRTAILIWAFLYVVRRAAE